MMIEVTVPVLHTTPALSDDDEVPVWILSHQGSHSGGGETPLSASVVMKYFSEPDFQSLRKVSGYYLITLLYYCTRPRRIYSGRKTHDTRCTGETPV
jgi:hypothetical protein